MNRFAWRACCLVTPLAAQEKIPARFGIEADVDRYSQATPQDTLRSLLKAVETKRVDYVLAHLAEPTFVDDRVQKAGKFETMVSETTKKLDADPESLRELRRFLTDGEWKAENDIASSTAKDVRGKQVYFKKIGTRWFLENRTGPVKEKQP